MKSPLFYNQILTASGMTVNDNRRVNAYGTTPFEVAGHYVVVPDREYLRDPNWDVDVAFHPLCENPLYGESVVLQALRKWMQVRINEVSLGIIASLYNFAVHGEHKRLKGEAHSILSVIPDADEKTLKSVMSLVGKIQPDDGRCFISFYLKKAGLYQDKSVSQLGVVFSPVIEELHDEENQKKRKLMGVQFRKADFEQFKALMDILFPEINQEAFNFGCSALVLPRLETVLRTYAKIMGRMNEVVQLIEPIFSEEDASEETKAADLALVTTDLSYMDMIDDMESFRKEMGPLKYNRGTEVGGKEPEMGTEKTPSEATKGVREEVRHAANENEPTVDSDGKNSWAKRKREQRRRQSEDSWGHAPNRRTSASRGRSNFNYESGEHEGRTSRFRQGTGGRQQDDGWNDGWGDQGRGGRGQGRSARDMVSGRQQPQGGTGGRSHTRRDW